MRAARLYGPADLRIDAIDAPRPGRDEVLLQVAHNGVCGTDLHLYFDGPRGLVSDSPHPLTGATLPQVLGHEFSGVVVERGAGVDTLAVGDRVCVEAIYTCGTCPACVAGMRNLCPSIASHGVNGPGGGLSDRTVVHSSMAHRLPDNVTLAQGALVEPMAVSFEAIDRSHLDPGERALVIGAGPIGLGVLLGLRAIGVDHVMVAEPSATRRQLAAGLGAEEVADPEADDVVARAISYGARAGVDAAFECAGAPGTFATALRSVRPRGRVVTVAMATEARVLSAGAPEIEVVGSRAYAPGVFAQVIALMAAGAYPTAGWVEHVALGELTSVLDELRAGGRAKVLVDLSP